MFDLYSKEMSKIFDALRAAKIWYRPSFLQPVTFFGTFNFPLPLGRLATVSEKILLPHDIVVRHCIVWKGKYSKTLTTVGPRSGWSPKTL